MLPSIRELNLPANTNREAVSSSPRITQQNNPFTTSPQQFPHNFTQEPPPPHPQFHPGSQHRPSPLIAPASPHLRPFSLSSSQNSFPAPASPTLFPPPSVVPPPSPLAVNNSPTPDPKRRKVTPEASPTTKKWSPKETETKSSPSPKIEGKINSSDLEDKGHADQGKRDDQAYLANFLLQNPEATAEPQLPDQDSLKKLLSVYNKFHNDPCTKLVSNTL
ncbi:extracellular matrix protein [Planoprotostelium fungivorum]|uniref:Extracellular matrix protein n=1 Tax=Planoprotostelium fungivorum TaxID=1890364 RepID=A0A2P6MT03_9EUKA|nr:extracellular matrix protein [Planoprotostelium fungivorum]